MRVLYLEDNAQDAGLVQIELRRRAPDIQLDVVSTLAEALARLERFHAIYGATLETATVELAKPGTSTRYDLVLTDLDLPDGSGKTLLAQVRSKHLPLPVVVLNRLG